MYSDTRARILSVLAKFLLTEGELESVEHVTLPIADGLTLVRKR